MKLVMLSGLIFLLLSFSKDKVEVVYPTLANASPITDTTFLMKRKGRASVKVHYMPHTDSNGMNIGNIVLLPGWNYSSLDWCTKTTFCEKARDLGYNLLLVDMSKSVYASQVYPETRSDMKKYATREWFIDTLIPVVQENFDMLRPEQNNFVLGLSTGGRGASLLCLDLPHVFKKGAALSGDFNQASMPNDNLMRIFYGSYTKKKERWIGEDNVYYNLDRFEVPFYIGHGLKDNVVPTSQSIEFYEGLRSAKPDLDVVLNIDSTAKHDYNYWGSEVNNVLGFFLK